VLVGVPLNAWFLKEEIVGSAVPIVKTTPCESQRDGMLPCGFFFICDMASSSCVSEHLESGTIGFNRGVISDPAASFGRVNKAAQAVMETHHGIVEIVSAMRLSTAHISE
jgi:hypothetical protein